MKRWVTSAAWTYGVLTLLVLVAGVVAAVRAPIDPTYGPIQKLLYLHLPVAANTFFSAMVVFVASVGYMSERRRMWDDLAHAAAATTVINGAVLIITGMFWAKVAWDSWWVWSPRLTFSLVLWLLYSGYMVIRVRVGPGDRRAIISAIYGALAFLDVPLLYLSSKLLPDVHPTSSTLTAPMMTALWLWMIAVTLLTGGMIAQRYRLGKVLGETGPLVLAGGTFS